MFGILLLTDCSNAHAACQQVQPRAQDRSLRILLCYLRDHLSRAAMSFVDSRFNVADAGTKHPGNQDIWVQLVKQNRFTVGFMGRKMARALEEATKKRAQETGHFPIRNK